MVKLDKNVLSLTVGVWTKLSANEQVEWSSNNSNVYVDDGWCLALTDKKGNDGKATITGTNANGEFDSCRVTVVPWSANVKKLEFVKNCGRYYVSKDKDRFLAILTSFPSNFKDLYETKDFVAFTKLMTLPDTAENIPILNTPHGYFINCTNGIYRSSDLKSVTLSHTMNITTRLYHSFDYHYDEANDTTYIYCGQYSVGETPENNPNHHKVYRGTITRTSEKWDVVFDFPSQMERINDPENTPWSVRHIHVVTVDPYTGDIYVATGDYPWECYIFRSQDKGENFQALNKTFSQSDWTNSQPWRALSIWFTKDYIYWNNDTATPPQAIWRLKRTNLLLHTHDNDLKERVISLDSGAQWFQCSVKDEQGEDMIILGSSVEGSVRDLNSRTYSIKEKIDGSVEVNEIQLNDGGDTYNMMLQLEPKFQDSDGYIYLNRIGSEPRGVWKTKLVPDIKIKRYNWKNIKLK